MSHAGYESSHAAANRKVSFSRRSVEPGPGTSGKSASASLTAIDAGLLNVSPPS